MKNTSIISLLLLFFSQFLISQIRKDIDNDGIIDSVDFDKEKLIIICKLSTKNYNSIKSMEIETFGNIAGVRETKNGFEFYLNYMRSGYSSQFRYDEKQKKIRLIGMSRYEYGPASNDGSGKSSINLLTNNYIGEWNHFNLRKNNLMKLPPIKFKMNFPKIYLETYDDSYQEKYTNMCVDLYLQQKEKFGN